MTNHPSETVETLRFENFEPLQNTIFVLSIEEMQLPLLLSETSLLKNMAPDAVSRPPFSLLFRSESPQIIPQGLHQLEHPALGKIALFLVPVGGDAGGVTYEAVFN